MDAAALEETKYGAYRVPVDREVQAFDLPITGSIPRELSGTFVRNGANPRPGTDPAHLFLGDGMLHGLRIENGRARWYRNRWVRTKSFVTGAPYMRKNGKLDFEVGPANTNAVVHAGKLLALVETSLPYEITPELETVGPHDFEGKLKMPFAAHPKRCARTGELHAIGLRLFPGALSYHRIDAAGNLISSRRIAIARATMMHDFALTDRFTVFMDLPIVFDLRRAMLGRMPFRWSDSHRARLGVLPRDTPRANVRWLDIDACFVFHVLNAFDEGDRITVDVVRYAELWRDGPDEFTPTTLHRWTIDLAANRVREETLDERSSELPRIDDRRTGLPYRFGYAVERDDSDSRAALLKYDLHAGTSKRHDFGAGRYSGEPVFIPGGSGEDAGWLACFVYDAAEDRSEFVLLDASDVAAEPVARIALPQRVPSGFHGNWIADAALATVPGSSVR
jgi:carotenoid cleavage dioxygenase